MKIKPLLFLVLILSTCFLSFAQTSWLKDDAQWVYRIKNGGIFSPPSFGYEIVTPHIDTIVDDMACKIYQRHGQIFAQSIQDTVDFTREEIMLCEEENRILFYDPYREDFFMIYDFNLPTDTVIPYYQYSESELDCTESNLFNQLYTIIIDTFSINYNGNIRRAQKVDVLDPIPPILYGSYTIIEGMGAVYDSDFDSPSGYIAPGVGSPCIVDYGWTATPCSYSDNDLEIQFQDSDCFFLESTPSNTTNIINSNLVELFPNPTSQKVKIHSKGAFQFESIMIYNLQNQLLTNLAFQSEIDISQLNAGIYLIKLQTKQGLIITKKLIKN